jgi:hypothetical protein
MTQHRNLSGLTGQNAENRLNQGTFAGTIGANNGGIGARWHGKGNLLHRWMSAAIHR